MVVKLFFAVDAHMIFKITLGNSFAQANTTGKHLRR